MDPPPVQYVTTSDGYDIAYGVSGQGVPLVFMPGSFDHVQLAWRYPALAGWLEELASRFRLVQFNPRGSGMSTRHLPSGLTFKDYQRDVEAVVQRLGLEKFIFFSCGSTFRTAIRYSLDHVDQVLAIVVAGATRSTGATRAPALWLALPDQDFDLFLYSIVPRDRTPEEARQMVDYLKQAYDQGNFVLRMQADAEQGINELLARLNVPILVMHARDYALFSAAESMQVAQMCGARMVLIDGTTIQGDPDQGIRAIESFLADVLPASKETTPEPKDLSAREIEVLRLVAAGHSNQEIADSLVISLNTVRRHVSNIFDKIGAVNRAGAIAYAHNHGLVISG